MKFTKEDTLRMKGIAILLMLLHHCFVSPDMYQLYKISFFPFSESLVNHVSWFGKECVGIFALLSGYGLAASYKKSVSGNDECRQWYGKRLLALYKNYWFVFVMAVLVCSMIDRLPWNIYFANRNPMLGMLYLILDFFGISNFFGTPILNGAWWYMGLAVMIVLLTPAVIAVNRKAGSLIVMAGTVLLPKALGMGFQGNNSFLSFTMAFVLGVLFEENNFPGKVKSWKAAGNKALNKSIKFLVMTAILYLFYHLYMILPVETFYDFNYGVIAAFLVLYCYEFILDLPVIRNILEFFGKHSMNIFYLHIFIRSLYAEQFIYSFRHFLAVLLVLLLCSIAGSELLELLKKILRYDKIWAWVERKALRPHMDTDT